MKKQEISQTQAIDPVISLDSKTIIEHGESPTGIILAIAILMSVLIKSITGLIQVILREK